jgi:replicative DNA helicase
MFDLDSENPDLYPHSTEAERYLLSCCLVNDNALDAVSDIIEPDDMYWPANERIFRKMMELHSENKVVDVATLSAEGEDGDFLSALLEVPAVSARSADYARQLRSLSIRRKVIKAGHRIVDVAKGETDADTVLDEAEAALFAAKGKHETDGPEDIEATLFKLECELGKGTPNFGLRTGIDDINDIIIGMGPGTFNILAARPGTGKTCMALDIARHISKETKTLFFSIEMTKKEIAERMIAAEGTVGLTKLRTCTMDDREKGAAEKAISSLRTRKLTVDDSSSTMYDVQRKVRRAASRGDLGLVIVDYIQLLNMGRGRSESRQYEVAQISRAMKLLAREYGIPVLGLSQLSRQEDRYAAPKKPTLSTLRDSGALEQDADQVWFIHRPDETSHECEFIVAKNRNGPMGDTFLRFWPQFTPFTSITGKGVS